MGDGLQLEDQSMQMEQLRQELEARQDELDQAQRSLGHAKQVLAAAGGTNPLSPVLSCWGPCRRVQPISASS